MRAGDDFIHIYESILQLKNVKFQIYLLWVVVIYWSWYRQKLVEFSFGQLILERAQGVHSDPWQRLKVNENQGKDG